MQLCTLSGSVEMIKMVANQYILGIILSFVYLPIKPVDSLHVHRDTRASPCENGSCFCFTLIITQAKAEELIHVICFEQSSLLWVFQHSICKKLLENLSAKQKMISLYIKLSCPVL